MDEVKQRIQKYYKDKIDAFGATPKGVDWKDESSQSLRFDILSRVIEGSRPTVLDYGCGYGAYAEHLKRHDIEVNFTGYDLVKDSIQMAKEKNPNGNWISALPEGEMWDYVLASGIFNTLAETSREDWESYIFQTLSELHSLSNKAFGCNFLTDYSDKDKMRPDLYYADPAKILSYCLKKFGRTVTLIHDYPLYEFTILVRSTK